MKKPLVFIYIMSFILINCQELPGDKTKEIAFVLANANLNVDGIAFTLNMTKN